MHLHHAADDFDAWRGYGDAFPIGGIRHRFDEPIDPCRWMILVDLHPFRKGVTDL